MRLEFANLEHYQDMSDEDLKEEMFKVQMQIEQVDEDMVNDSQLQAAIALAQTKKLEYTSRRQMLKKFMKTLHQLAVVRGLI
jgi:hypothetical protein